MTPHTFEHPYIRFNGNTGYARQGDTVILFADRIENRNQDTASDELSLQLWACESPYTGGSLTGWRLAGFPLGVLPPGESLETVRSAVPAGFPESGDFAISLVIAEWDGEGFNLVHDFHNYPCRDLFVHPRLEGTLGYRCLDDTHLVVEVERIHNPRDPENMSGTLSLELWALYEPYGGGDFQGHALGAITLGSLAGGNSWQQCAYDMEIAVPPADTYTLVLMLREWSGNGYITRDHCNFSYPVMFPIDMSAARTSESLTANELREEVAPAPQAEEVVAQTVGAEPAESLAREAGQAASRDTAPTLVPQNDTHVPAKVPSDGWKRTAQRWWLWVKQNW